MCGAQVGGPPRVVEIAPQKKSLYCTPLIGTMYYWLTDCSLRLDAGSSPSTGGTRTWGTGPDPTTGTRPAEPPTRSPWCLERKWLHKTRFVYTLETRRGHRILSEVESIYARLALIFVAPPAKVRCQKFRCAPNDVALRCCCLHCLMTVSVCARNYEPVIRYLEMDILVSENLFDVC